MNDEPGVSRLSIDDLVRACHDIMRAYAASIGDVGAQCWDDTSWFDRARMTEEVGYIVAYPQAPPIVPFELLSKEQRVKAYLFQATVRALSHLVVPGLESTPKPSRRRVDFVSSPIVEARS